MSSIHVPLFWQGLLPSTCWQSSMFTSQVLPSKPGEQSHWYLPIWFLQVAPLTHGSDSHSSMSTSQCTPVYPGWQSQIYSSIPSIHSALFWHSASSHSLILISQFLPLYLKQKCLTIYRVSLKEKHPVYFNYVCLPCIARAEIVSSKIFTFSMFARIWITLIDLILTKSSIEAPSTKTQEIIDLVSASPIVLARVNLEIKFLKEIWV